MDVARDNQRAAQTSYTGEQTAAFAAKIASSARINQYSYAYSYDNAGNLTANGTTTYTYDALNRMIARGTTRGDQSPR